LPSRPGEFHPEPLTEPDLTLSRHPARATARRLPPSIETSGSSRRRLTRANGDSPLPSLHEHYARFIATTKQSAPGRRIGTFGLAVGAACALYGAFFVKEFRHADASFIVHQFLCSIRKPVPSSRPALRPCRRAQELSRLAVAPTSWHAPPLPGHTLTASSTTARLVRSG